MDNLKIYQICHDLIDYFATLTSPKKSYLGPIFRTGGSIFQKKSTISYIYIYRFRKWGVSIRACLDTAFVE